MHGDTVLEEAEASSCISVISATVLRPQHRLEFLGHEQFSVRDAHFGLSEMALQKFPVHYRESRAPKAAVLDDSA